MGYNAMGDIYYMKNSDVCILEKPILVNKPEGLTLTDNDMEIRADFSKSINRIRKGVLGTELLVKAAKVKNASNGLRAVDATAGFGEDSLLLAAAGFEVDLYEYDEVIYKLLEDAVKRALEDEILRPVVSRMHLHNESSIEAMKSLEFVPNVVLLDPMFPERQKSASVKKKFQLLQKLEHPCDNEAELLEAAMKTKAGKIVIKRPSKGPYLCDRKPDYSIAGKAIRYDVIFNG